MHVFFRPASPDASRAAKDCATGVLCPSPESRPMQPELPLPADRPEGSGSRRPASPEETPVADPPTVRSGGAEAGSSSFRRKLAAIPLPEPGDRIDTFELEEAIGVGG